MGNQQSDQQNFLSKNFPNWTFDEDSILQNTEKLKSYRLKTEDEGFIIVRHIQEDIGEKTNAFQKMRDAQSQYDPKKHPNLLFLKEIECGDENGIRIPHLFVRPYIYLNLSQLIKNHIPKLHYIEKLWLIFQILCGVCQLHTMKIVHGDIKTENILITSSNQVLISDYICIKPAYIKSDDLRKYNLYFGELDNNQRCYTAPERFVQGVSEEAKQKLLKELDYKADIFSAGCVIAEILMDGVSLFDRAGLNQFINGSLDPKQTLDTRIKDANLVRLIMDMIAPREDQRPNIEQCLYSWNKDIFPNSFSRVFFQLSSSFLRPVNMLSDMKISTLKNFLPSIWSVCLDQDQILSAQDIEQIFYEPIEKRIFKISRMHQFEIHEEELIPNKYSCKDFEFISSDLVGKNNESQRYQSNSQDKESIIIVINWIGKFIETCFFPQTKRCALEILYRIALASSLDIRHQFILPYVFSLFQDDKLKVVIKSIEVAVMMFEDIIDSNKEYSLSDLNVFESYIWPKFDELYLGKNQVNRDPADTLLILLTYTKYLPVLADVRLKFTDISSRLKFKRKQGEALWGRAISVILQNKNQNHSVQNFESEQEKFRSQFIAVVNSLASSKDQQIQRLIYINLGRMAQFFGTKITADTLVPLISQINMKSDFMTKISCLKSLSGIGVQCGEKILLKHLLILIAPLLFNSEEQVVFETLNILKNLLYLRLIPKYEFFGELQKLNQQDQQDQGTQKKLLCVILPFLLHPNTQIRKATIQMIQMAVQPTNRQNIATEEVEDSRKCKPILSKKGPYIRRICLLKKKLRPYLKDPAQTMNFLSQFQGIEESLSQIREPLSDCMFQQLICFDERTSQRKVHLNITQSDAYAFEILKEVIQNTNQNFKTASRGVSFNTIYNALNYKILLMNSQENDGKSAVPSSELKEERVSQPSVSGQRSKSEANTRDASEITPLKLRASSIGSAKKYEGNQRTILTSKDEWPALRKAWKDFQPQGNLIVSLSLHRNPVNSVLVTEDQRLFLTASREDGIVHGWEANAIVERTTNRSKFHIKSCRKINSVAQLERSKYFVVAGSNSGVDIYDAERLEQAGHSKNQSKCLIQSLNHEDEAGDMMNCLNTTLPISHQDFLVYSSQKGQIFMHDIRSKQNALSYNDLSSTKRGMVTSMTIGQDPYQVLYGTIGGYVMVYDIRFNMVCTAYKHSLQYPINSIASFNPEPEAGIQCRQKQAYSESQLCFNQSSTKAPMALISSGSPSYEVALLNLERGNIEYLFTFDGILLQKEQERRQYEIRKIPSFYRESYIRDWFSWPEKSESYRSLTDRYLMQTQTLISSKQIRYTKNLDDELYKVVRQKFPIVQAAYDSSTACRKVLIPRLSSRFQQGAHTANYAITGSNDNKIRYINLTAPSEQSRFIYQDDGYQYSYQQDKIPGGILEIREAILQLSVEDQQENITDKPNYVGISIGNRKLVEIVKNSGNESIRDQLAGEIAHKLQEKNYEVNTNKKINSQQADYIIKEFIKKYIQERSEKDRRYEFTIEEDKGVIRIRTTQKETFQQYNSPFSAVKEIAILELNPYSSSLVRNGDDKNDGSRLYRTHGQSKSKIKSGGSSLVGGAASIVDQYITNNDKTPSVVMITTHKDGKIKIWS